ncbi:angiomotin [Octopus sinensis]|uniref:Angiomotin n=1 Tax=Octopus sinensis TaxID=2607531 RepID=A0A6P7SA52_9MOLL|nr:angiomotin [Octopus sinensis]
MQSSPYRDPPPYPGHSKQLLQPGLRQSFSGSETSTDVSLSSTENLSTSQRQEPQGEETHTQEMYYDLKTAPRYSMLAQLGMQIPVDIKDLNNQPIFAPTTQQNIPSVYTTPTAQYYSASLTPTVSSGEWQNSQMVTCTVADSQVIPMNATVTVPTTVAYTTQCWSQHHMDPQVLQYLSNLPPPPEYPRAKSESDTVKNDLRRSYEMLEKVERTRSQPDLTRFESQFRQANSNVSHFYVGEKSPLTKENTNSVLESHKEEITLQSDQHPALLLARTKHIVEILNNENRFLKEKLKTMSEDLNRSKKRVVTLQKCEDEISKVTEEYQTLEQKSRKIQQWEAAYRRKLEEENKKIGSENKYYKEQLQGIGNAANQEMSETDIRTELRKKEAIIANLMSVNKELQSSKELLQEDVVKSHQMIEQQRSEIEILDNALTNAQSNVVRLEEECKKKQLYMDRLDQLQKAFVSLQMATEKREQMEQQLRNKLEKELGQLRIFEKVNNETGSPKTNNEQDTQSSGNIEDLKKLLQEKDTRMLQLEAEVAKWEQRCLTESTKNQLASKSSDGHQQLEKYPKGVSFETEKLLAESKSEKLRHMEEAYQAKKKSTELEARVKELQTSLVEKEAMVKALQRSSLGRSSGVRTLHCTPLCSNLITATSSLTRQSRCSHVEDSTFRDYGLAKHTKSGSANDVDLSNSYELDTSCTDKHNSSSESDGKEDAERKLWQV